MTGIWRAGAALMILEAGSLFERAFPDAEHQKTVVLFKAAPRYQGGTSRKLVDDAAARLGIARCVWFE